MILKCETLLFAHVDMIVFLRNRRRKALRIVVASGQETRKTVSVKTLTRAHRAHTRARSSYMFKDKLKIDTR